MSPRRRCVGPGLRSARALAGRPRHCRCASTTAGS